MSRALAKALSAGDDADLAKVGDLLDEIASKSATVAVLKVRWGGVLPAAKGAAPERERERVKHNGVTAKRRTHAPGAVQPSGDRSARARLPSLRSLTPVFALLSHTHAPPAGVAHRRRDRKAAEAL